MAVVPLYPAYVIHLSSSIVINFCYLLLYYWTSYTRISTLPFCVTLVVKIPTISLVRLTFRYFCLICVYVSFTVRNVTEFETYRKKSEMIDMEPVFYSKQQVCNWNSRNLPKIPPRLIKSRLFAQRVGWNTNSDSESASSSDKAVEINIVCT